MRITFLATVLATIVGSALADDPHIIPSGSGSTSIVNTVAPTNIVAPIIAPTNIVAPTIAPTNIVAPIIATTIRNRQRQDQTQFQSSFNENTVAPVIGVNASNNNKVKATSKSSATGGTALAQGGNASTGAVTVDASSTSVQPNVIWNLDYVAWKQFQLYGRKASRTTPGSKISPYDTRAAVPTQAPTPSPDPAIERYNKFLKDKSIYSNTIGFATIKSDKMEVPLSK